LEDIPLVAKIVTTAKVADDPLAPFREKYPIGSHWWYTVKNGAYDTETDKYIKLRFLATVLSHEPSVGYTKYTLSARMRLIQEDGLGCREDIYTLAGPRTYWTPYMAAKETVPAVEARMTKEGGSWLDPATEAEAKALLAMYDKLKHTNFEAWKVGNRFGGGDNYFVTLGCDPEIFVVDARGEVLPAFDFLPAPAALPRKNGERVGANVYWDGFQAEMSTVPETCLAYLVDSVQWGLKDILAAARKHNKDARLTIRNVIPISPMLLRNAADEHVALGCKPSLNVHGLAGEPVLDGRALTHRFAGGHIHIGEGGYPKLVEASRYGVAKFMDMTLGLIGTAIATEVDDPIRRKFYGLPGEIREPKHGLEYRVLSNYWLSHPAIMHFTFDLARTCYRFGRAGAHKVWDIVPELATEVIRSTDGEAARKLLKGSTAFKSLLKVSVSPYSTDTGRVKAAEKLVFEGLGAVVKNPDDIETNWKLKALPGDQWVSHSEGKGVMWCRAAQMVRDGKQL
jgi:hypothetical protein